MVDFISLGFVSCFCKQHVPGRTRCFFNLHRWVSNRKRTNLPKQNEQSNEYILVSSNSSYCWFLIPVIEIFYNLELQSSNIGLKIILQQIEIKLKFNYYYTNFLCKWHNHGDRDKWQNDWQVQALTKIYLRICIGWCDYCMTCSFPTFFYKKCLQ